MQNFQLEAREEYYLTKSKENLFHLRPLPGNQSFRLALEHNFAPIYCPKTEKIIRTLPLIDEQKSSTTLFHSEIDIEINSKFTQLNTKNSCQDPSFNSKSLRNIDLSERKIFMPKPSSRYCQICKQTFSDYLKHINHPLHKKKSQGYSNIHKDIDQLSGVLMKKSQLQQKKKLVGLQQLEFKKLKSNKALCNKKDLEIHFMDTTVQQSQHHENSNVANTYYPKNIGSKKRIVEDQQGEKKAVTLSFKNLDEIFQQKCDLKSPQPKQNVTSLKNIVIDIDQMEGEQIPQKLSNILWADNREQ